MSMSTVSGGANVEAEGGIMVNSEAVAPGRAHRTMASTLDTGAMCSTTILNLAAGDEVSLFLLNESSTANLEVAHASLTVNMLGGT